MMVRDCWRCDEVLKVAGDVMLEMLRQRCGVRDVMWCWRIGVGNVTYCTPSFSLFYIYIKTAPSLIIVSKLIASIICNSTNQ